MEESKFLGYTIIDEGKLTIAKESVNRLRDKVRQQASRNLGRSLKEVVSKLNEQLMGWIGYFKLTEYQSQLKELDGWIRRKRRCYKLKQKKWNYTITNYLIEFRGKARSSWDTAKSGKSQKSCYFEP